MDVRPAYPSAFAASEGVAAPEWVLRLEVHEDLPQTALIYALFSVHLNFSDKNLMVVLFT